jgi:hypothetical protein
MLELIETKNIEAIYTFIIIRTIVIMICWAMMVISCFIDLWSGRSTAKFLGEKLESCKYRKTIIKIGDYSRVMIFGTMFDCLGMLLPFYTLPFGTMLCATSVILIEGKSVNENSVRKKAHAADIPEIIKSIMQAASQKDAEIILEQLTKK